MITGAGRGLGRGLAEGFLRDGAIVVGFGRTAAALDELAAGAPAGRVLAVAGDVGVREDVERLFATTVSALGRIDVLVNNAASYPRTRFLETPIEEWARVMEVNVIGMAHCCLLALPIMTAARFGRILNVGSFAWRHPIPASSSYAASKGAVAALTRAIASEVDPALDVRVNEFLPGFVRSGMNDEGSDPADVYPHLRHVASLPQDSPHGATFLLRELWVEHTGLRHRLRQLAGRLRALRPGGMRRAT